jgi:hypothetical protein
MFIENATKNMSELVSCQLPGGVRARRFSRVEGVGQGVVRSHEPVTRGISRKVGNGERSRKAAKPQKKKHAKNSVAICWISEAGERPASHGCPSVTGIGLAPEVCGLAYRLNHALSRAWS